MFLDLTQLLVCGISEWKSRPNEVLLGRTAELIQSANKYLLPEHHCPPLFISELLSERSINQTEDLI